MMIQAFHGNYDLKEEILASVNNWLNMKMKPLSTEDLANRLLYQNKTFNSSDCILEFYDEFPEKLGLPNWLGNLLSSINLCNSNDFSGPDQNYELFFYPAFLNACNVGVDYSLLFHEWEIMIFKEVIPTQERDKKYILDLVELHNNTLFQKNRNLNKWVNLQNEIQVILQNIGEFTGVPEEVIKKEQEMLMNLDSNYHKRTMNVGEHTYFINFQRFIKSYSEMIWNTGRAAFLSIDSYIASQDVYATSSEAAVDALIHEQINYKKNLDVKKEKEFIQKTWLELMNRLILMVKNWK